MEMRKTDRCYECGKPGQVAGTVWSGSEYVEYCEDCMKKFADDQYVGMTVRHDDEDDYETRLRTKYGPRKLVAFDDHSGDMAVFSVPDDEVERMCIYEICPMMIPGGEWPDCKTCPYADGTEGDERMTYHFLKISPEWFVPAIHREKTFEIRRHDRDFKVWDKLVLMEYANGAYTGRYTIVQVKCIVTHEMFPYGIAEGYCVMGVSKDIHGPEMKAILRNHAVEQAIDPALLEVQL